MRMFFCSVMLVFVLVSCSRENELNEGKSLYKEGFRQSAIVKIKDGLIHCSAIKDIDSNSISFAPYAVYEMHGLLTILYPKKHIYKYAREVVSLWYTPSDDMCVVTDGTEIFLFMKNKEFVIPNPSHEPIKAVAYTTDVYFLGGKDLYVYSFRDKSINKFSSISFSPPETFKYYNAYINSFDNYLIVICGIAGVYNLWVLTTTKEVLISSLRIATWKHFLYNGSLFTIEGAAGHWTLISINIITKQKKEIKTFKTIVDLHMTQHGIAVNTGDSLYIYCYDERMYVLPFTYTIKGELSDCFVVDCGRLTVIDSKKFFEKVEQIAQETGCCTVR